MQTGDWIAMTKLLRCAFLCAVLAATAPAQSAPAGKTAVLQVQNGILSTREGHQAFSDLESKFSVRKADLDKRQNDIAALQDQLRKGAATMSEEAQRKVARDIDRKTKALDYEAEMARADYQQEQADMMEALARKFHAVVDKYARDKEIGIVVDVSSPQTPAFWWANAMDITSEVVRAYDSEYPAASAPGQPASKKQD
jgi:Skp family chaperone for outer membrane proteins